MSQYLMMDENLQCRTGVLDQLRITGPEQEELLCYNQNVFDHAAAANIALPLKDEPFVARWEEYAQDARRVGVFHALKKRLVQLNFPVEAGVSETRAYRKATRQGIISEALRQQPGLLPQLQRPDALELIIHQTPAGKIPIIAVEEKEDFNALLRALTFKNEPAPVPDSQGAVMIAGYNNWDRIWDMQRRLQDEQGEHYLKRHWPEEFKKIIPQKHLYQDKCMLLSRDEYSGVSFEDMGLDKAEWKRLSFLIRREHECIHYVTKRVFSSMRNNIFDELIADYAGITAAIGTFRADWFFKFVGLEHYPEYREGGRLQNYRGSLSDKAFAGLRTLAHHAARNLEVCDQHRRKVGEPCESLVFALTHLTLEALAAKNAPDIIRRQTKGAMGRR